MSNPSEFVITRTLDAPRGAVYKAWTDPNEMKQWWGPKGMGVIGGKMDFRPGGTYHYGLRAPTGQEMWGKFTYKEITQNEKLVWVNTFSDAQGGVTRHPFKADWPLELLTTVTFEEPAPGKTKLTIRWNPINPAPAEQKTFDDCHDSMTQGWGGTLEQFSNYLGKAAA